MIEADKIPPGGGDAGPPGPGDQHTAFMRQRTWRQLRVCVKPGPASAAVFTGAAVNWRLGF